MKCLAALGLMFVSHLAHAADYELIPFYSAGSDWNQPRKYTSTALFVRNKGTPAVFRCDAEADEKLNKVMCNQIDDWKPALPITADTVTRMSTPASNDIWGFWRMNGTPEGVEFCHTRQGCMQAEFY
jgi:hypothetical protein